MIRKIVAILLLQVFIIVGCGSTGQTATPKEESPADETMLNEAEPLAAEESLPEENTEDAAEVVILDYGDAASFEAALNRGENLEGKTVGFIAGELHPQSAMGYNIWAGEHLNFISSRNPDVKAGDYVTVRADVIESSLGSWLIRYEKIDNAEIGDTTITAKQSDAAETVTGDNEKASSASGSFSINRTEENSEDSAENIENEVAAEEEKKDLIISDSGWYINDFGDDYVYVEYCVMITNPNETYYAEFPTVYATVKNGDGSILGTDKHVGSLIMPGDTITLSSSCQVPVAEVTEDAQIIFEVEGNIGHEKGIYSEAYTTDFEFINVSEGHGSRNYISGEIVNHYSEEVGMVNLALVLRKDGEIVFVENTFVDSLKPEKAKAFMFDRHSEYPEHDSIELHALVW